MFKMWCWLTFICPLFELIRAVKNLDYYKDISDKVFNEDMLDVSLGTFRIVLVSRMNPSDSSVP